MQSCWIMFALIAKKFLKQFNMEILSNTLIFIFYLTILLVVADIALITICMVSLCKNKKDAGIGFVFFSFVYFVSVELKDTYDPTKSILLQPVYICHRFGFIKLKWIIMKLFIKAQMVLFFLLIYFTLKSQSSIDTNNYVYIGGFIFIGCDENCLWDSTKYYSICGLDKYCCFKDGSH